MRVSGLIVSPSHNQSDEAPTNVAVQKLIRIVNLDPIFERAMNRAISPIPKPTIPLNISHLEASEWKLFGSIINVATPKINVAIKSLIRFAVI